MKKGRYNIKRSDNSIDTEIKEAKNIWYLLPYSPFLIFNILKKIRLDDAIHTTDLFGRDPRKIIGESLYEE